MRYHCKKHDLIYYVVKISICTSWNETPVSLMKVMGMLSYVVLMTSGGKMKWITKLSLGVLHYIRVCICQAKFNRKTNLTFDLMLIISASSNVAGMVSLFFACFWPHIFSLGRCLRFRACVRHFMTYPGCDTKVTHVDVTSSQTAMYCFTPHDDVLFVTGTTVINDVLDC